MNKLYAHSAILRGNFITLIGVCLCLYFTYHVVQGNRGIVRLMAANKSIATLSLTGDSLAFERKILEKKVAMMRPGQVDEDLLEERVRLILGFRGAGELLIVRN